MDHVLHMLSPEDDRQSFLFTGLVLFRMCGFILLAAMLSCSCGEMKRDATGQATERNYTLTSVTGEAPTGSRWALIQSSETQVVFQEELPASSTTLSAKIVPIGSFQNGREFLTATEAQQVKELSTFQRLSLHFDYTSFKGSPCVLTNGIFRDSLTMSPDREITTLRRLTCRHPEDTLRALRLEITQRSGFRGIPDSTLEVAETFFRAVQFKSQSHSPR
jgi:hypothetical protein